MRNDRMSLNWKQALLSVAAGILLSFVLALQFFDFNEHTPVDKLFLLIVPAFAITVCLYYLLPVLMGRIEQASASTKIILFFLVLLSALIATVSRFTELDVLSISAFVSLLLIFGGLVTLPAPAVQKMIGANLHVRIAAGWLLSIPGVYFVVGFLDNYYGSSFEFICVMLVLQFAVGLAGYFLAGRIVKFLQSGFVDIAVTLALFLLLFMLINSIFLFGGRHPQLFDPATFKLEAGFLPVFLVVSLLSLPWQAWLLERLHSREFFRLKETKLHAFVNDNTAGILLALVFFSMYFLTASMLNHPRFDVDDVFFDADVFNWRLRLITDNWGDYYWRSVHPFVLILLKPPIDLIALFLKGDKLFGAYFLIALAGALCVFLAWKFIIRTVQVPVYALLIASLLGLSASHLIFGSLIESYIFLALCLILFYVLLAENRPFSSLVMAGLATIGITHSNFAQNVIAFFSVKLNIRQTIRFIVTVLVFLVLLTLLNELLYPGAHPFFFIPSTLEAEQQNLFPLNTLRIQALVRAFLFHNVIAPVPILYTGDIPFVQFRFFKPEINSLSRYETPLQDFTVWFWIGLLALAVVVYFFNFKKNHYKSISLALLACILMNLALHLRYGKEMFLYSPNWTYALILLAGLGWQGIAKHRWFHIVLLTFLALLAYNNNLLLREIIGILAPQI